MDNAGWTRTQVAKHLGISERRVRDLEDDGTLTPTGGKGAKRLHDPEQVEYVRRARLAPSGDGILPGVPARRDESQTHEIELGEQFGMRGDSRSARDWDEPTPEEVDTIFAQLHQGMRPVDIVSDFRIPVGAVERVLARYIRLCEAGDRITKLRERLPANEERAQRERIDALEQQVGALDEQFGRLTDELFCVRAAG